VHVATELIVICASSYENRQDRTFCLACNTEEIRQNKENAVLNFTVTNISNDLVSSPVPQPLSQQPFPPLANLTNTSPVTPLSIQQL
jgi:hypothetical protein